MSDASTPRIFERHRRGHAFATRELETIALMRFRPRDAASVAPIDRDLAILPPAYFEAAAMP